MMDLGIHKAAIGEKFLASSNWKRNPQKREYETMINGEPVHVLGQTMVCLLYTSPSPRD